MAGGDCRLPYGDKVEGGGELCAALRLARLTADAS